MSSMKKPSLLEYLVCPECGNALHSDEKNRLSCGRCGNKVIVKKGIPLFTPVPTGMKAAPKFKRGPDEGSPWRQANWRFLEKMVASLPKDAIILDFGAGHGDFSEVLSNRKVIALDVFPYDEVDIVCDLQQAVPFKNAVFDAVVLMNVLEHIQHPVNLIKTLAGLLRPGGSLFVTVPFLLKLHQLPYDFYRYSHRQLINIGNEAGLETVKIEAYYDPVLLMKESAVNIQASILPEMPNLRRKITRFLLLVLNWLISRINHLTRASRVADPEKDKSPYPIGYHVVYRIAKGKR